MNKYCVIIYFMMLLIISRTHGQCRNLGQSCTDSSECTTQYCKEQQCIVYGQSSDDVGITPCAGYDCAQGSKCVLDQVTCVKAPCRPSARCAQNAC